MHIEALKKRKEAGHNVPFLDNMPKLSKESVPFYSAFELLSGCRPPAFDTRVAPIPLTELEAFLRLYKITDEVEVQDYVYLVKAMDALFIPFKERQLVKLKQRAQQTKQK